MYILIDVHIDNYTHVHTEQLIESYKLFSTRSMIRLSISYEYLCYKYNYDACDSNYKDAIRFTINVVHGTKFTSPFSYAKPK